MRRRNRRSGGFSAIEAAVAASGTVIILMLVTFATQRSFDTWEGTVSVTEIDNMANQAVDRMTSVLADAGSTTIAEDLSAPTGGSAISFRQREGFASGAVVWGPVTKLSWVSDPSDPRDDEDNDGDGLIDEGQIVLADDTGRSVVLARNVAEYASGEVADNTDSNGNGLTDEQGLSFEMDGRRLVIRLTLTKRGADGQVVARTSEGSIALLD